MGHQQPAGTAEPGAEVGGRQSGGAAGDDRRHPRDPLDLLQQPLPVKQIAGGGVDDPVRGRHCVQEAPPQSGLSSAGVVIIL